MASMSTRSPDSIRDVISSASAGEVGLRLVIAGGCDFMIGHVSGLSRPRTRVRARNNRPSTARGVMPRTSAIRAGLKVLQVPHDQHLAVAR